MVVQGYYSVTSDMPTEMMLSVAAENLQTKMSLVAEEQHRLSLIKPVHIWITRWVSLKCLKPKSTRPSADRLWYTYFQCSQPNLHLPDPQSALCWGVPPHFCNQPPPTGPGGERGGTAGGEDGGWRPGTPSALSSIVFLVFFKPHQKEHEAI